VPSLKVSLPRAAVEAPDWAGLREELGVVEPFPPDALAEAEAAAAAPTLPDLDRTDVPFFTIDPEGSMDLDQAMHLATRDGGYRVSYAIADVAAFVKPGGALDAETHRRGETYYAPDVRVPLHPTVLGEGAASLLPDEVRPALVWTLDLDERGSLVATDVRRARVRSRRRLDYGSAQRDIDAGSADEQLVLLRQIGELRLALARERGAVDLPTPEQVVTDDPGQRPRLDYRAPVACEGWNAQISLLTGMAAAALMIEGRVGLLRTLPPPDAATVASLRRSARGLGLSWRDDLPYGDFVSGLDPADPRAAATLAMATRLLRGAAYTAFDGSLPEQPLHSAVAAPYAHCTAPLRRLADRYVGEICLALSAGIEVPPWARAALPALPDEMAAADRRAHALERAVVDLAEVLVLGPCVGETFDAVMVESGDKGGTVQLVAPAVRAPFEGKGAALGTRVKVRLASVDRARRRVSFVAA
jgi:exoribonuclease R